MVLVDTSVWIDHLAKGEPRLADLLESEQVATHPFVIGELACGRITRREEVLSCLAALPRATEASSAEVLHLLEKRRLPGKGLGWIDVHLLTSALIDGLGFWTRDRRLADAARGLGVPRA